MEVTQDIEVAASSDDVWSILSDEFGEISSWAARMLDSKADDSLAELGGRHVTTVEYGPATETLYRRDAERRSLGYWVTGPNLPPPLSDVQTEWRVTERGANSSVELRFLGVVTPLEMQPMLEERLATGITPLLEELKHYAETGEPHPNNAVLSGAPGA